MKNPYNQAHLKKITACTLLSLFALFFVQTLHAADKQASVSEEQVGDVRLPVITVVADKVPSNASTAPASVTPVTRDTIQDADVQTIKDAAVYAPNVYMGDFGPRRLSNPYFRGIGAGPDNQGITTSIDGVPQFSANSSSIQFVDVGQVEFVRGPQAMLYGRNALGGMIHLTTRPPSEMWQAETGGEFGNYDLRSGSFRFSGPLSEGQLGMSLAGGYSERNGYVKNRVTGNDVDYRQGYYGKGQLLFRHKDRYEARFILSGENDDDGDYALGDLKAVRSRPSRVSHDYDGYSRRDVGSATLLQSYFGDDVTIASITGFGHWRIDDATDLDYTPLPLLTKDERDRQYQTTQEFRFSSPEKRPIMLSDAARLSWLCGAFLFDKDYDRHDRTSTLPNIAGLLSLNDNRFASSIDTAGLGTYAQGALTFFEKLKLSGGLRFDYEHAHGRLSTTPSLGATTKLNKTNEYKDASPSLSLSYHITPQALGYLTIGRGYKAGGFNASAPAGKESFDEEYCWSYEAGAKTSWLDERLEVNAALFWMRWRDIQLYMYGMNPIASYYVDNAGNAESRGAELQMRFLPASGWDIFGSAGLLDTRFLSGSRAQGGDVSGNRLPLSPRYNGNAGVQYSRFVCPAVRMYARGEFTFYGPFKYDASNDRGQSAYGLVDLRAGISARREFAELWVKNALDKHYVPVAFPYPVIARSGYIGECGAPRTVGIRIGFNL